jgi:hypothetical protein
VRLPRKKSQVLLLFDCEGKMDIKTESDIMGETNKEDGDLKVYLPFIKLHLNRLDWVTWLLLRTGKLDNTLYVSKTGILGDSDCSSLCDEEPSQ